MTVLAEAEAFAEAEEDARLDDGARSHRMMNMLPSSNLICLLPILKAVIELYHCAQKRGKFSPKALNRGLRTKA
jgi:hypothetical protein